MPASSSVLLSILKCKCPQCHAGDLFLYPNPYVISKINLMPANCPVCNLSFEQETGFYWGAMYVSYGLTVMISFINFVCFYFIWGWLTWEFLVENTIVLILTLPLVFRYSRVLFLYLFGKYKRFRSN